MKAFHVIDSAKVLHLVEASDKDIAREIVNAKRADRHADVFFEAEECRHDKYLPPSCPDWMEYVVGESAGLCDVCCSHHVLGEATHVFVRSEKEIRRRENDML